MYNVNLYNKAILIQTLYKKKNTLEYRCYLMCNISSVLENGDEESETHSVESGKSDGYMIRNFFNWSFITQSKMRRRNYSTV